jgi:hypothetical protein
MFSMTQARSSTRIHGLTDSESGAFLVDRRCRMIVSHLIMDLALEQGLSQAVKPYAKLSHLISKIFFT